MKHKSVSRRTADANTLLRLGNLLVLAVIVYSYPLAPSSEYVDAYTIVLTAALVALNVWTLTHEANRRNPLVFLLVFVSTVFYVARVLTLLWWPESATTFAKWVVTLADLNFALAFVICAQASVWAGILVGVTTTRRTVGWETTDRPAAIRTVVAILGSVALVNYFGVLSTEVFGRGVGYISALFMNQEVLFLFAITLVARAGREVVRQQHWTIWLMALGFVALQTLSGGKGGMLQVLLAAMLSMLAVRGKVDVGWRAVAVVCVSLPLVYGGFVTATVKRQLGIEDRLSMEQFAWAAETNQWTAVAAEDRLRQFSHRLGYLDYATEVIARQSELRNVLNIGYYAQSVVDNVLSPGFDLFDTPRVSHAVSYLRRGEDIPTKRLVAESYQSDQLTLYGEFYGLFGGFWSLAVLFGIGAGSGKLYRALEGGRGVRADFGRVVVLNLFFVLLNSFGLDWLALTVVGTVLTWVVWVRWFIVTREV